MRRILLLLAMATPLAGCATWKDGVNRDGDRQLRAAVPLPPNLVMVALVAVTNSYSNAIDGQTTFDRVAP